MTWRWAIAGLGLALAGCPVDQVQGGRYACQMDAGDDQCPGQWRCGFEGYCHEKGQRRPWRCETHDHCEGGWQCGLSPQRDAGECHDPDAGAPYPCATSAQCTAQWHCGPALTCYDRRVPDAYACRADAGDCADGWRCGRDRVCQDQAKGAAYLCREADGGLEDGWCEQGWRCAPEGTCIDPRDDALGAVVLLQIDGGEKIHPLATVAAPEHFAVSPIHESGLGAGRQTFVFVRDGGMTAEVVDSRGALTVTASDLGAFSGTRVVAQGSRGERDTNFDPYFATDEETRIWVLFPDGGAEVITLKPAGGVASQLPLNIDLPIDRIRLGTSRADLAPHAMGFSARAPRAFGIWGDDNAVFEVWWTEDASRANFMAFPNNRIVDALAVHPIENMDCIFAVDQRGLWVSQQTQNFTTGPQSYFFEPLLAPPFTNDLCVPPTSTTHRIRELQSVGRDWLALRSAQADGGSESLSVLNLRGLWSRGHPEAFCSSVAGYACQPTDRIPVDLRMGPCPACPGAQLLDFSLVTEATGQPRLELRCGTADGQTTGFLALTPVGASTQCATSISEGESGLFSHSRHLAPDDHAGGQVAWASADDGFLWSGPTAAQARATLFDRAPTAVGRRGPLLSDTVVFTREASGAHVPAVGFHPTALAGVVAGVEAAPEWVVAESRQLLALNADGDPLAGARVLGIVGTTVTPFDGPFTASRARRTSGDGGTATSVIVTSGAAIFAGDLDGALAGTELFAAIGLRAVAPNPINALAFPSRQPAGVYLRGYAVTPNGVFRVTAQSATAWVFEPVPLPASLAPAEVWFENTRGRVGFTDGTVYALPSRVPIAPPLADAVVDYAQACGQQLALTAAGVYRLEAKPGAAVGAWARLELPDGFAPAGFARGRIHGMGDAVYVSTRNGETARVRFSGCPPP